MFGSTAIQVTFKLSGLFTRVHSEFSLEIFVFFQIPPLTPPAKTVSFVESFGSKITALVLPPTFVGPRSTQLLSVPSPGVLFKAKSFNFRNPNV